MQSKQRSARSTAGSSAVRVLFLIAGVCSLICAALTAIIAVVYGIEEVYDASDVIVVVLFLLIAAMLTMGGVTMIVYPAKVEQLKAQATPAPSYDPLRNTKPGSVPAQPAASVQPAPAPRPAQPQPAPQPAAQAGFSEEVARLVNRSEDIFATCKDLVHSEAARTGEPSERTHLASMLAASGVMEWSNAPTCDATRLTRTNHFWLRQDTSEMNEDDYDRLVAVEAAINLDLDLPKAARAALDDPSCAAAVSAHLRDFAGQSVRDFDFRESLGAAYPGTKPENTPGEWFVRANAVNSAECVRVPFRLVYDLRVNAAEGVALIALQLTRPRVFSIVAPEASQQVACARGYALRVSYLLARLVLESCPNIERVEVTGHERGGSEDLLAIRFTRDLLARLRPVVAESGIDGTGFPTDPAIRAQFGPSGWFEPIEAPVHLGSELVSPRSRFIYPELDDTPLSAHLAEVTGGRVVADLSINENAMRIEAADRLEARWNALDARTCENVVATLVAERDATANVSVLEACSRTIEALTEGTLDPEDNRAIRHVFVSGGALEAAAERANRLLEDDDHADPDGAVKILTEALDPVRSIGFYEDDESTVYRYFGSVSERLVFNLNVWDRVREVRLVPDAYFDCLSSLASAYIALGENEHALEVCQEIRRVAPTSIYGALRKVRALEHESRIMEAADLIKEMLALAATPRDAALAQYRLAYMEWKLGREDLGVACYQRSLAWNTPMSQQAREELDDLLQNYSHLKRLEPAEVERALKAEGIPLGFDAADVDRTLQASVMLIDEGHFWTARPLLSVICNIEGDDVMIGIHRSIIDDD